ncbi:hypothetical protein THAR02_07344 [Trichoderma harzianum]|uniref:Uncharacterized protein n=1 Tax=Trichoderma harzianum TaxID=5544 RepID=A0A0F9X7Q6_TRIHA|nr:hypothetical protein THAR02_07344 [Trichoderma harzianum]
MALINAYPSTSLYNGIPFIHDMGDAAQIYADDLNYLKGLLDKHGMPPSVCIKLIHIHFHLNEGEILAISEISAPPYGQIPFLAPMTPDAETRVYGCHYIVDDASNLQPFEFTTNQRGVDLAAYPAFVSEFCAAVAQRGLKHKFGLSIKSGAAEHGSWIELDYPEKRATFLIPSHVSLPQSEHVEQRTTKTLFSSSKGEIENPSQPTGTHIHTEHYHAGQLMDDDKPIVEGVTTDGGLFLTGIPLDPASAFYTVVSAISAAA